MKKIMFNDKYGLTEAVLSGRKTQTRRLCRHQRPDESYEMVFPVFSAKDYDEQGNCKSPLSGAFGWRNKKGDFTGWNIPKYKVGEVVAIAQNYADVSLDEFGFFIKADSTKMKAGWKNKMFVRADLMPHHIRITGVRVEQLQDISDEDCIREGIYKGQCGSAETHFMDAFYYKGDIQPYITPQKAYAALIDHISGEGIWESNPWVFVYYFEKMN